MDDGDEYTEIWKRNRQELYDYVIRLISLLDQSSQNVVALNLQLNKSEVTIAKIINLLNKLKESIAKDGFIFKCAKGTACVVSILSTPLKQVYSGLLTITSGVAKFATEKWISARFKKNKEDFEKLIKDAMEETKNMKEFTGTQIELNSGFEGILRSIREESCLKPFLTMGKAKDIVQQAEDFNRLFRQLNHYPQVIDPKIQEAMLVINNILIKIIKNNYKDLKHYGAMFTNYVPSGALDAVIGSGMLLVPPEGVPTMKGLNIVLNLFTLVFYLETDIDTDSLVKKIDNAIEELGGDLDKMKRLKTSTEEQFNPDVQSILKCMNTITRSYDDNSHLQELLLSAQIAKMKSYLKGP